MEARGTTVSALALVAVALAGGIAPDRSVSTSAWVAGHMVLPDGPKAGELYDPDTTPQLAEIQNCLDTDHPCTRVSVRKAAQTAFTVGVGVGWLGSIIANAPARTLVVMPTLDAAREFNSEKFHPVLEETPVLRRRVAEARSRSVRSSTTLKKRFAGGTITLTGANSTVDLRSKTVRYLLADEIDDWPLDLNGQGDPMDMADARQRAFYATGEYKKLEGSTPTIKGASRIDAAFEAGDQRYYQVPCPHCRERQRLVFKNLRFNKEYPYNAHYVCAVNGCVVEHHHKRAMVLAGEWVAEAPGPGRHPSFHLDTLTSLLVAWDDIAKAWLDAQGKPEKLKAFVNLWLGESWEERGEAPEWERLYARRAMYPARVIPVGGLLLTGGADVQQDGIYYEVVAWGRDKQSWSLDIGFLEGDTSDPDNDVWRDLDEVYERAYPDAYGNAWRVDAFAVDAGFNSNTVYLWTRARARAYAIKGEDGWAKAAIASTPTKVEVSHRGKRKRRGAELWHVGTWPLKAEFYAYLRKQGRRDGHETDPYGYCHFSEAVHDERYFKQLVSEFLKETKIKGRPAKVWHASGPNHFHDCRIYNMAMASRIGVGARTPEQWDAVEAERTATPEGAQPSLLPGMSAASRPAAQTERTAEPAAPASRDISQELA